MERALAAAYAKSRHPDDNKDEEQEREEKSAHAQAVKAAGGQCVLVGFGVGWAVLRVRVEGGGYYSH